MTAIILGILKVIGIVLLCILAFVLITIVIVLFVPLRYRARGSYLEEKPEAEGKVSWLLSAVSLTFFYQESKLTWKLKILGIPILPKKEKKSKPSRQKRKKTKKPAPEEAGAESQKDLQTIPEKVSDNKEPAEQKESDDAEWEKLSRKEESCRIESKKPDDESGEAAAKKPAQRTAEETREEEPSLKEQPEKKEQGSTQRPERKILKKWEKLKRKFFAFFRRVKETISRIVDKLKNIKENIDYYKDILGREETKQVLSETGRQLWKILRHIGPRKLQVRIVFGLEDPADMGEILAIHGMLYPILEDRVRLVPDFERKCLEGDFFVKGRIRLVRLLICGIRIICNKNLWKLIRLLKKEETADGRK